MARCSSSMVLGALLLISCATWASATDYTVGDSGNWTLGVNYSAWTAGKSFVVDDKLVFNYAASQHNVEEVSASDYSACSSSNPITRHTTSPTTITLATAGKHYFICGISGHCLGGMKVEVDVASSSSSAPSPAGTTTPPPPSTTTTTPPSPSAAGTLSPVHVIAMVVGLVVLTLGPSRLI